MARPKKQVVDYFPLDCNSSREDFIVQSQHGNDGCAFWIKLQKLLGKSEGHVFDYNNPDNWLFLLAETHVPETKAEQILATLADVGSIDRLCAILDLINCLLEPAVLVLIGKLIQPEKVISSKRLADVLFVILIHHCYLEVTLSGRFFAQFF